MTDAQLEKLKVLQDGIVREVDGWDRLRQQMIYSYLRAIGIQIENIHHNIDKEAEKL